jgi:excisionase family DNA binding protein
MSTRITAAERDEAKWTWLTVAEVAQRLGKSPSHVRNLIRRGEITYANLGTGKRPDYAIRPEWVTAFVESRTEEAA